MIAAAAAVIAFNWKNIRERRDANLVASDWTQLAGGPLTTQNKTDWATTRQLWRDIPQTYSADPATVVWPSVPTSIPDVS